jgi:hypothetical protein
MGEELEPVLQLDWPHGQRLEELLEHLPIGSGRRLITVAGTQTAS